MERQIEHYDYVNGVRIYEVKFKTEALELLTDSEYQQIEDLIEQKIVEFKKR